MADQNSINNTLVAPVLGTPASGNLSNCTGYPGSSISGTVPLAQGGTNANLTASNGGIFYSSGTAGAILPGTSTARQLLTSGASTTPSWTTSTYPATNAVNTLLYASSANVMAELATASNGVLVTSGGGVPSISSTLPTAVLVNIPGRLTSFQYLTSGSAATYTPTANTTSILIEAFGGGGGGGGSAGGAGNAGAGSGGGGGGYVRKFISGINPSIYTATYTIGAVANGGATGNHPGTAGNATTYSDGTVSISAGGGAAGAGTAASASAGQYTTGGGGGAVSGGDFGLLGGSGGPGWVSSSAGAGISYGGYGGNSALNFGNGAQPSGVAGGNANGLNGVNYGGGGGGGASANSASTGAGGNGGSGLIIVWEFT